VSSGPPDFRDSLHAKQQQLYDCTDERLYSLTGRRHGKTAAFGRKAARLCITRPGANVIYIARSLKNAKNIIFPELRAIRDLYRVPIRFRRSNDDVKALFPGDSEIMFMGIKTVDRIDDLRGFGKDVELIGIDELGAYNDRSPDWVEEMVEDGAFPLTGDCAGQMWLMGNPGKFMRGWWYRVTRLRDRPHSFPVFRGTGFDNPFLQNALAEGQFVRGVNRKFRAWLTKHLVDNGKSYKDSAVWQEWLGLWCQNTEAMIFDYDPQRNAVGELPRLPGAPLDVGMGGGPDWSGLDA
jgi:hypothetical protein